MSFCTKCGNKLDDGANFCGFCGAPIGFGRVLENGSVINNNELSSNWGAGNNSYSDSSKMKERNNCRQSKRELHIHIGSGGIYYKKTSKKNTPENLHCNYSKHTLYDVVGREIIDEISKSNKSLSAWLTGIIFFLLLLLCTGLFITTRLDFSILAFAFVFFILGCVILFLIVYYLEVLQREYTTFLNYELEPNARYEWMSFINLFCSLCRVDRLWFVEKETKNWDHRRNAGAESFSFRSASTAMLIGTKCKTGFSVIMNIPSFAINCKSSNTLFLPSGIIIYSSGRLFSYSYDQIQISSDSIRFIEDGYIPKDTEIIGHTWRFVNNDGSPDRRFNGNRKLDICKYGVIRITGNNICYILQISNNSIAEIIEKA